MATEEIEHKLIESGYLYVAGVDESGVGCLAGDVFVSAVIFPRDFDYSLIKGVDDSKKKSEKQRQELSCLIKEHAASYSVASASVQEINKLNIYWAKFVAAKRAIEQLSIKPDYVLMDGNAEIPDIDITQRAIVKGDSISLSIAAASILAKVARDDHITQLADKVHDDYGWASNKSYYSSKHINALQKHGKTKWHRDKFVSKFIKES